MKKRRVLVTAVGGNIGQGVIKALRASTIPFEITGIDMHPLSAGFSFADHYFVVPRTAGHGFRIAFEKIIKKQRIEAVYVCSPSELSFFSQNRQALENKLNTKIFVNKRFVVEIGSDKQKTQEFLKENNFPFLKTVSTSNKKSFQNFLKHSKYPIFLKPRLGFTSKNVFLAKNKKEALCFTALIPDLVAQEYADGEEYTASTLSNRDGKVKALIVLKRDLNQGTTYRTELYQNKKIQHELIRIADALGSEGPCNFQFRLVKEKPYIFEINPRFSGTTGIRYLYGFNDAELIFRNEVLGEAIHQPKFKKVITLRYWNEVYGTQANLSRAKQVILR